MSLPAAPRKGGQNHPPGIAPKEAGAARYGRKMNKFSTFFMRRLFRPEIFLCA